MSRFAFLLLLGVALTSPSGAVVLAPPAPLCRVTASIRPAWRFSSVQQLTVTLTPDCPPDGIARIRLGQYGGPGSRATGPTETLTASRPTIIWPAQPRYRTVLWVSQSGKTYTVPLREVRAYAPEDR